MGQFLLQITGNTTPPYIISVKKNGDNTERWLSGGDTGTGVVNFLDDNTNSTYTVFVNKQNCNVVSSSFIANCNTVPNPITPTPITPVTPNPVTPVIPNNNCDFIINSINIVCNTNTGVSTATVNVTNPSNKTLRYGILGFVSYQSSNTFELEDSDSNGYTFMVAEAGKENICDVRTNRVITCNTTPVAPTPAVPNPTPVQSCNLSITSVDVSCQGNSDATITVNVNNPDNYELEYQIDNYIPFKSGNTFGGITNTGSGYTIRVRNKNNISCQATTFPVYVDCNVGTPPSNTPVISCNPVTNLAIYGATSVNANSRNSYLSGYTGSPIINYSWNISGQGTSIIGASNGDTCEFQFGNSNGTITLTVTNCGGTYNVEFPFTIASTPAPNPVTPVTPVGCSNIVLTNKNVYSSTPNYLTFDINISGGVAPYTFNVLSNGGQTSPNITSLSALNGDNTITYAPPYIVRSNGNDNDITGGFIGGTYDFKLRVVDANGCPSNIIEFNNFKICRRFTVKNEGTQNLVVNIYNCTNTFSDYITIFPNETSEPFNSTEFYKSVTGSMRITDFGYI